MHLAAAIQLAEKAFSVGEFESKALILVTDGEELQGDAVIAAREAAKRGLRIFTVGVGSLAGGRIPERDRTGKTRFIRNEFGTEVVSRLNQRVLQRSRRVDGVSITRLVLTAKASAPSTNEGCSH